MTATEHAPADRGGRPHDLVRGASPATIRSWLFPEDRESFVAEYRAAMDEARSSLELGPVQEVVERWRQIAVLQTDPDAFRRSVRRMAEVATGEPSPDDEPLSISRTKAGM